jgi:hypothetical protein
MKKFTLALLLCTAAFITTYSQPAFTSNLLFVAKLEGDQEVPPLTTTAVGEASFALNATHDTLCINVTVKGLSGPIASVQIYQGPIGGIGTSVVDLTSSIVGTRISTYITAPQLSPQFIAAMMGNQYYLNVHTSANPGGEIRGQIGLEADIPMVATPDSSSFNPPVSSNGTGLATFDLSRNMISMHIKGHFENLSGPVTGINLQNDSGQVVQNLDSFINGNDIDHVVDPTPYVVQLMNGHVYLYVNTASNPNGEIKGLVQKQLSMSFDATMDGSQETPPVPTSAMSIGMMTFSPAGDSIWYDFIAENLSGPPTQAHFHIGAPGVSGPPAIDLSGGISGNRIKGVITSNIPAGFMDECLRGNVYVNIHTAANQLGEIRGQLRRYVREGFTYSMDAAHETPPTSSSAIGSGIASIDRDIDNLHFRMIVDGLTGPITNAHFHSAPPDTAGPIIFSLTPYFTLSGTSDVAFNYWMKNAGFDSSMAALFFTNNVYVNLHTAAFPNGEVRGNIVQGGNCSNLSTDIHSVTPLAVDFNMYPNPISSSDLHLNFEGLVRGQGLIEIDDLNGREVFHENIFVSGGENNFIVPARMLPGVYIIKMSINNSQQLIRRLIKN